MSGAGSAKLVGAIRTVRHYQEETSFAVLELEAEAELVTAVGTVVRPSPGERLELHGRFVDHPRFGRQFRFERAEVLRPATPEGIERLLASGIVEGIGGELARRIVEAFGEATLDVIERSPERLVEVRGIGDKRLERVKRSLASTAQSRRRLATLTSHGLTTGQAIAIERRFGERAVEVVERTPYRLAVEIDGIGFLTADRIAGKVGVPRDSLERAEAGLLHVLGLAGDDGHTYLERDALLSEARRVLEIAPETLERAIAGLTLRGAIVVEAPRVFLGWLHRAEATIAARLGAIVRAAPSRAATGEARPVAGLPPLAPAQATAVARARTEKVLVITGGPGTGKTTTIRAILAALGERGLKIELAAPTGRAARRMTEATGREARTIHRLLEIDPKSFTFLRGLEAPLELDALIVDECSMLDVLLAEQLLLATPDAARLILVGDVDQLPSVGPGAFLRDLIEAGVVSVVRLDEIFRQGEASAIVEGAHAVRRGEVPRDGRDFFFVAREDPEALLATLRHVVVERIPRGFGLDPRRDVQVLTPMVRSSLGVGALNALLQPALNPEGASLARGDTTFRVGDKVIQTKNNYELGVFNGDIGFVRSIDAKARALVVTFDDREARYDDASLDQLGLAYAITIHKSQGSEFEAVVVPLHTQHYVMLRRNLLYTAITRGKRLVVVIGSRRALELAIADLRAERRDTVLAERLRAELGPGAPGAGRPPS